MAKVYRQHTTGKAVGTSILNPFPLLTGMENEKGGETGNINVCTI